MNSTPSPQRGGVPVQAGAHAMERIGDILRRAREQRGDDLQQIADYLCIRRSYLEAIEESRYDAFPADAYVIGFLRSYANLLGFDGRQAIDRYRGEMAGRRKKPQLSMPQPMGEGRAPSAIIIAAALVAVFLLYIVWYGLSSTDRAKVSQPPALPTTPATTDVAPVTPTDSATATGLPLARLTIRADQASWIQIADKNGHIVYDQVLKAGELYRVPDTDGLTLTTSNGAGLVLTLDGIDLQRISAEAGRAIHAMGLDTASLQRQFAPTPSR